MIAMATTLTGLAWLSVIDKSIHERLQALASTHEHLRAFMSIDEHSRA